MKDQAMLPRLATSAGALLIAVIVCSAEEGRKVHFVFRQLESRALPVFARPETLASLNPVSSGTNAGFATEANNAAPGHKEPISGCGGSSRLDPSQAKMLIERIANEEGFDAKMALAVARQESRYDTSARSPKGAIGLMQLMPATAKDLGVDPCDVEQNVRGGIRYLKQLEVQFKNPIYYLAAYNAGPKRVSDNGGVPPILETVNYVAAILNDYHGWDGARSLARKSSSPTGNIPKGKIATSNERGTLAVATADGGRWKSGFVINFDE